MSTIGIVGASQVAWFLAGLPWYVAVPVIAVMAVPSCLLVFMAGKTVWQEWQQNS